MELYPLLKYKEFFIVFKGTKSVAKKGLIDPFSLVLIGFHWKPLLIYLLYILLNSRLNFLLFIIKIFLIQFPGDLEELLSRLDYIGQIYSIPNLLDFKRNRKKVILSILWDLLIPSLVVENDSINELLSLDLLQNRL